MERTSSTTPRMSAVCLADVRREETAWLWPGYIPRGTLSLLDGDPGLGKSFITLDLAARVTRGWAMPPAGGATGGMKPANVLILNAEDDPARTLRPRLEALGADLKHVHLMNSIPSGDGEVPVTFPGHLTVLEHTIAELQAALVIIDPLMAFLGGEVDSHKDSDIRRVLAKVKGIAEKTQAAILVVRHLNKLINVGEAMYRGGGSIGIIGAARSALMVARHPTTPCLRVLARIKGNLCNEPPALGFAIDDMGNGGVGVAWFGELDMTANDLLAKKAPSKPRAEALAEAERFLRDELARGPVAAAELLNRAGEKQISEKTLRRAKDNLGIESRRFPDMGAGWFWRLPDSTPDDASRHTPSWPPSHETREKHEDGQVVSVPSGDLSATQSPPAVSAWGTPVDDLEEAPF